MPPAGVTVHSQGLPRSAGCTADVSYGRGPAVGDPVVGGPVSFNAPGRLWLLVAVVALIGTYVLIQRRRRHYAVRFTNVAVLASVAPRHPGWRRQLPATAMVLAIAIMVLGFAQPTRRTNVAREERDGHARDRRLRLDEGHRRQARSDHGRAERGQGVRPEASPPVQARPHLVRRQRQVLAPPTTERGPALRQLDSLKLAPNTAYRRGDLRARWSRSTATHPPPARGKQPAALIVVLSDGNTTVGRSTEAAAAAAASAHIPVSTIAYGTDAGTVIAEGRVLRVPVDRQALRAAAETTGGKYFEAATGSQLKHVYDNIGTQVDVVREPRGAHAVVRRAGARLRARGGRARARLGPASAARSRETGARYARPVSTRDRHRVTRGTRVGC